MKYWIMIGSGPDSYEIIKAIKKPYEKDGYWYEGPYDKFSAVKKAILSMMRPYRDEWNSCIAYIVRYKKSEVKKVNDN